MSYGWGADESPRGRENAVRDVLDGMSVIGAALVWHVQAEDLKGWVDAARTEGRNES